MRCTISHPRYQTLFPGMPFLAFDFGRSFFLYSSIDCHILDFHAMSFSFGDILYRPLVKAADRAEADNF